MLDVHQLVRHDALDLVAGEALQQALGRAHDGVIGPAAGRERVRLGVVGDRDGGHRQIGPLGKTGDHVVELGGLVAGDRTGATGLEGQLVAEPVRATDHHQGEDESDHQ